jgi:hypothetical protein
MPPPSAQQLAARRIVELYRSLELALTARGVPRPSGTPPLRHAETLAELGHPLAAEVLALTRKYQEVRFGGQPLDENGRRDFADRVRAIKTGRQETRAA